MLNQRQRKKNCTTHCQKLKGKKNDFSPFLPKRIPRNLIQSDVKKVSLNFLSFFSRSNFFTQNFFFLSTFGQSFYLFRWFTYFFGRNFFYPPFWPLFFSQLLDWSQWTYHIFCLLFFVIWGSRFSSLFATCTFFLN